MTLSSYFITYEIPCNLAGIDTEWRKTQCMPREVCVDVGKEFGATTNTFFKPPCVSIYRCGGCCNSEGLQCMNISTNYISKTVSSHSFITVHVLLANTVMFMLILNLLIATMTKEVVNSKIHRKNS